MSDRSPDAVVLPEPLTEAIMRFGRARYDEGEEASSMWSRPVWTDRKLLAAQDRTIAALSSLREAIAGYANGLTRMDILDGITAINHMLHNPVVLGSPPNRESWERVKERYESAARLLSDSQLPGTPK